MDSSVTFLRGGGVGTSTSKSGRGGGEGRSGHNQNKTVLTMNMEISMTVINLLMRRIRKPMLEAAAGGKGYGRANRGRS